MDRRLSVAPMMEWTDRHCRFFHRLLSRRALLYTEMVGAAAVIHGPREQLIGFSPEERPLALQLGGSEPNELAQAARIAADRGYDEINLNIGCPSDRVQKGAFGACLMREPDLVAECCAAMIESVGGDGPEITVKCRIGVDEQEPEQALPAFVERVAAAGVASFAVHARKAWLNGLSPKENRSAPPLDYDVVRRLRTSRPDLEIALNGGVDSLDAVQRHLSDGFDGAMIGRAAYQRPYDLLAEADARIFGEPAPTPDREAIIERIAPYIAAQLQRGVRLHSITRHMLGLFAGQRGARAWRRFLSERASKPGADARLLREALAGAPA